MPPLPIWRTHPRRTASLVFRWLIWLIKAQCSYLYGVQALSVMLEMQQQLASLDVLMQGYR
eukprot:6456890-Amphidinium_carterae.2